MNLPTSQDLKLVFEEWRREDRALLRGQALLLEAGSNPAALEEEVGLCGLWRT